MSSAAIPDDLRTKISQWDTWVERNTDLLLSLDDRCRTAGTPADRADVAAAFVARKAIVERLSAIKPLAERDGRAARKLAAQPVVDDLGGPVGADLDDAAELLDAIITAVDKRVAGAELSQSTATALAATIDDDLLVAERLAAELGEQVNYAAQLRRRRLTDRDLAPLAPLVAALRTALVVLDDERRRLVAALASNADRLRRLSAAEQDVRVLSKLCRDKVLDAPRLAVPSVAAVGAAPDVARLAFLPWRSARAELEPYITKLDRVELALDVARRRFQAALDDRNDLRGLLQGYRSKAGANGLTEDPALDPLYRQAETVLWGAPCDVAEARTLVQRYVHMVNVKLAAQSAAPNSKQPPA